MASRIEVCIDGPVHAARAFGRAEALGSRLGDGVSAVLYAAPLEGEALALGAYQHAPHALAPGAFEHAVLRRKTGGATLVAGAGIAYLALYLSDRSALVACPAGKLLNRYARGLLSGLRALQVPAYYFGRDFVSANADPCAYIAWAQDAQDRVCIELFVALEQSFAVPLPLCGYPSPSEPRFRGKPLTTLSAVLGHTPEPAAVLQAAVDGYVRLSGATRQDVVLTAAEQHRAAELEPARLESQPSSEPLCWSAPHEEAIGFLSAGVALDARGAVRAVEIGGDLMQRERALAELRALLIGQLPDETTLGAALDRAYGAPGSLEGVRSLRSLQAALLDASNRARAEQGARPTEPKGNLENEP